MFIMLKVVFTDTIGSKHFVPPPQYECVSVFDLYVHGETQIKRFFSVTKSPLSTTVLGKGKKATSERSELFLKSLFLAG